MKRTSWKHALEETRALRLIGVDAHLTKMPWWGYGVKVGNEQIDLSWLDRVLCNHRLRRFVGYDTYECPQCQHVGVEGVQR